MATRPGGDAARLVALLEQAQHRFTPRDRAVRRRALAALATRPIRDAALLLRFHEVLAFLRAYPDDPAILDQVERALEGFAARVTALKRADRLDETGLAGTRIYCPLSSPAARWLARRFPDAVEIDRDDAESEERLGALLPWMAGLAAEDALVEVGVPSRAWLAAARGDDPRSDLAWLLDRLRRAPAGDALYDAAALRTRWELGASEGSRTRATVGPATFFHRGPSMRWRGPLGRRLPGARVAMRRATPEEGARLLDAAQAAVIVRYREVHAFNFADPGDVLVADVGRGVHIAWFGVQPAHRLPLRAHYGYLLLKNGVPVGYGDASLLFDWVEIAYNVFESFRQGESAFVLVRLLAFLYQRFGVRVFRLSRYQIGHGNDEAIASGAFWFYAKLGFRPTRPDLTRLAAAERRRIAREPGYRSPPAVLTRLAEDGMIAGRGRVAPAVAAFDVRRVALAAARRSAERRPGLAGAVARALGAGRWRAWPRPERVAFARWAPVLALIPDLAAWPARDRRALVALVRAKGGPREAEYLRRLRAHRRLRASLVRLGNP